MEYIIKNPLDERTCALQNAQAGKTVVLLSEIAKIHEGCTNRSEDGTTGACRCYVALDVEETITPKLYLDRDLSQFLEDDNANSNK